MVFRARYPPGHEDFQSKGQENLSPRGLQALVDQLGDARIDSATKNEKSVLPHASDHLVYAVIPPLYYAF
jgi:hypothetical protein